MKKVFWVDLPDPAVTEIADDAPYISVGEFNTLKAARAWLLEVHGMPTAVADFFISEGEL